MEYKLLKEYNKFKEANIKLSPLTIMVYQNVYYEITDAVIYNLKKEELQKFLNGETLEKYVEIGETLKKIVETDDFKENLLKYCHYMDIDMNNGYNYEDIRNIIEDIFEDYDISLEELEEVI